MKLSRIPSLIFFEQFERNVLSLVAKSEEILRTSVSVVYRQLEKSNKVRTRIKLSDYSEKSILKAILIVQNLEPDHPARAVMMLEMEHLIETRVSDLDDRELFLVFLTDKHYIPEFLLHSTRYFKTTEELFGWLRSDFSIDYRYSRIEDLKFLFNPILHSRVRGYRDKGSLGSQFNFAKEWSKDYLSQKLEEHLKEIRKTAKDTAWLIEGFLE